MLSGINVFLSTLIYGSLLGEIYLISVTLSLWLKWVCNKVCNCSFYNQDFGYISIDSHNAINGIRILCLVI